VCPDITPAGLDVLEAITAGTEAWTMVEVLEKAGHEPETLEILQASGLVERWERPDGVAITLTPWGEYCRSVVIRERTVVIREPRVEGGRAVLSKRGKPLMTESTEIVPFWGAEGEGSGRGERVFPRRHERRLLCPESVPDPRPGPEFLLDEENGQRVTLFAALFDGTPAEGIPVVIDRRLKPPRPKPRPKKQGRTP
jgi:hypothetical protein